MQFHDLVLGWAVALVGAVAEDWSPGPGKVLIFDIAVTMRRLRSGRRSLPQW